MKLANPFSSRVRLLYLYAYSCIECGSNGNGRGGLELNHIVGRESASAFNASLLCHECHSHIGHTQEEHRRLFVKNLEWLLSQNYVPTEEDWDFIRNRPWLIKDNEQLLEFLK